MGFEYQRAMFRQFFFEIMNAFIPSQTNIEENKFPLSTMAQKKLYYQLVLLIVICNTFQSNLKDDL